MNLEQIKALGAPFRRAEIRVSLRSRIAMIVVMIPGHENAEMGFQLDSNQDDPEQVGREIEEAAKQVGLIDGSSTINVIDLDSPKTAAPIPIDRVQTQKMEHEVQGWGIFDRYN